MTAIVNKKMSIDQYDILNARLDQALGVIVALAAGDDDRFDPLFGPAELLRQAKDAFEN